MSIEQLFEAFSKINVLVVGDVMIDRYLTGQVDRISPEAPVPVVNLKKTENRLGGAANVALNIAAMGATPILCSVIGKDEPASTFEQLLPEYGLSAEGILQSPSRITTVKTRVIAQNQHLLRLDEENTHDLSPTEENKLLGMVMDLFDRKKIDVLLFQDYNKGILTQHVIKSLIFEANKRNIPTAVDPKFKNFWAYKQVNLFKPNLKEIRNQVNFPVLPELDSLRAASRYINQQLSNTLTLITLSDKGMFIDSGGKSDLIPTQPRQIADVCGAGDTVISLAALGLALPIPFQEVAILANLAGGQVCEKVGVVPVDKAQLLTEYKLLQSTVQ